jgi:hypothetical protein
VFPFLHIRTYSCDGFIGRFEYGVSALLIIVGPPRHKNQLRRYLATRD